MEIFADLKKMHWEKLFTAFVILTCFSCAHSPVKICGTEIPRFKSELKARLGELSWARPPRGTERRIASQVSLGEEQREEWKNWAESKIKQGQFLVTESEDLKNGSQHSYALHAVSNELVQFWGYANQGKTTDMERSLAAAVDKLESVEEEACGE